MNKLQKELLKKQLANNLAMDFGDTNITESINEDKETLPSRIVKMLNSNPACVEPEKTYIVAIIYSLLLEKYFGLPFLSSLNNKTLLLHNGRRFFKTYLEDSETYDKVFKQVKLTSLLEQDTNTIKTIKNYFYKEFNIDNLSL